MLSSKDLYNKRVYVEGNKSYGRIRAFLFSEKTCVGFSIKRPDVLWMFHRSPQFIALDQISIKNNRIEIKNSKSLSKLSKNKQTIIN